MKVRVLVSSAIKPEFEGGFHRQLIRNQLESERPGHNASDEYMACPVINITMLAGAAAFDGKDSV